MNPTGSFALHMTKCSLHFDKPQKNDIHSLNKHGISDLQDSLTRSYDLCAMEHGMGMFNRIKDILITSIDKKKYTMFDAASEKLMAELLDLKVRM